MKAKIIFLVMLLFIVGLTVVTAQSVVDVQIVQGRSLRFTNNLDARVSVSYTIYLQNGTSRSSSVNLGRKASLVVDMVAFTTASNRIARVTIDRVTRL